MPPGHEYPVTPPPPPETPVEIETKGWVHRHPYLAAAVAVLALLFVIVSIIAARSGVGANENGNNWVGAGSVFFTGGQRLTESERLKAQEVVKQQSQETELGYIPIASPLEGTGVEEGFGNDLTALLAQLVQPAAGQQGTVNVQASSAFSFIPQGFISVDSVDRQKTPEAEALHAYGNEVGTYIQGFEAMHSNSAQILKDHAEERGNAEKAAKVGQLGYEFAELGRDLNLIATVPDEVKAAHSALATSYRILGTNLTKVAATKTDEEFLEAVNAYNPSVEGLSKRFLVLVGIFAANNVTFSSSEPGSIFMFNPTFTF